MKDFKNNGEIKLTPTEWLEKVAIILKEYCFVGKSISEILDKIDYIDALVQYEDGWSPEEFVDECIIGND